MRYREFRTRDKRPWDHPTAYRELLCALPAFDLQPGVGARTGISKEEDKEHPQDITIPKRP
jgi:hypothetical protein